MAAKGRRVDLYSEDSEFIQPLLIDQIYILPGLFWLQDREVDGGESEREDQAKDKQ